MAKKSVTAGEYVLSVLESGSIEVYRKYDNVKGALREVAEKEGFEYLVATLLYLALSLGCLPQ